MAHFQLDGIMMICDYDDLDDTLLRYIMYYAAALVTLV